MIDLNHVSLIRNNKRVLDDVTMTISAGETVLLTGASGSGKSSLISLLNGLVPELYDGEVVGEAIALDNTLPPIDFNEYVKDVGVVFQNPKTQFFTTSVLSELAFSMENYGIEPAKIEKRMNDIIHLFNLEHLIGKKVTELSGGQKQRIAFASACMLPHRLFLFDEPSSNLDYVTISQLSDYLSILKQAGHTMIVSEHRLFYLVDLVDRVVILNEGHICYDLTIQEFKHHFSNIQHEMGLRTIQEPHLKIDKFSDSIDVDDKLLKIEEMIYSYDKKQDVLHINNLMFDTSGIVGLIGENGSGKSTFIQILSGLVPCPTSRIVMNGKQLNHKERLERSFIVMQDVNLQLFFETVEKELLVQSKRPELFNEVVETLNLSQLLQCHPQDLSGGEKQRVAIGSAILSGKDWIILDEPTSGLDYKNMLAVSKLLQQVNKFGMFVLVISHDNEFLSTTTSHIYELSKGTIAQK